MQTMTISIGCAVVLWCCDDRWRLNNLKEVASPATRTNETELSLFAVFVASFEMFERQKD